MEIIAALVLGLVIGAGACWAIMRSRGAVPEAAREQIRDAVRASAAQAFQENNTSFLNLANERLNGTMEAAKGEMVQRHEQFNTAMEVNKGEFKITMEAAKGELKQRHDQFQELVKPLAENYSNLNPQIKTLTDQTSRLAGALSNNREIGNWGEIQLRRVAELAGMTAYCDFSEQTTLDSGERPDMIVRIPEGRNIIVDAKTSTQAYMEAQAGPEGETNREMLVRHARALRTQVDELSRKGYGAKDEESLDFVVMFVPGDQFLAAALQVEPGLVEYAMGKRVAIATPATLISLLWAVAQGWQQHRIARDAREIQQAGEEMHKRLLTFIRHYQNVGKELDSAVKAYNQSVGSFDRQLAPQGRKFAGLTVGDEDSFPEMQALDQASRNSRYAEPEEEDRKSSPAEAGVDQARSTPDPG